MLQFNKGIEVRALRPKNYKFLLLACGSVLVVLLSSLAYEAREWCLPFRIPANLGNRLSVLQVLESHPKDRPVSFAVVGDTHASEVFEDILGRLRGMDLDFIVNLGDFVREPTPSAHHYFMREMGEDLDPSGPPMLLLCGNHDVNAKLFSREDFEALYGPSTFSFQCGENLFVVLNNSSRPKKDENDWESDLSRFLSRKASDVRRIFVFMHRPPTDPAKAWKRESKPQVMELLTNYVVNYVISGHLHRYGRIEVGGTVVLVSGGGGGTLKPKPTGGLHHTVIIHAFGDRVTEEIFPVPYSIELEDKLEYAVFNTVSFFTKAFNFPAPALAHPTNPLAINHGILLRNGISPKSQRN
jgi:predicted MPP superfamily phosphohydrolase